MSTRAVLIRTFFTPVVHTLTRRYIGNMIEIAAALQRSGGSGSGAGSAPPLPPGSSTGAPPSPNSMAQQQQASAAALSAVMMANGSLSAADTAMLEEQMRLIYAPMLAAAGNGGCAEGGGGMCELVWMLEEQREYVRVGVEAILKPPSPYRTTILPFSPRSPLMHVPLPPLLPPSLPLTFLATLSPPRSHTRPRATSAAAPPYGRSRLGGKPAAADGPNAGV